jgi:acyl-CoA synthetase (NDP forming)
VKLNLRTEEEAARAFDEIRTSLAQKKPDARFEGVTVEPMVAGGIETIVGMTRDPLFGPVVLFGLGGVSVELLHDVSVRVAPITDRDAEEMLGEIRGAPLLDGYRGAPPVNKGALLDILHRVSRLTVDNPEILELDLNPIVAFPGNKPALVLDARVRVGIPAGTAPTEGSPGVRSTRGKKKDVPAGVPAAVAPTR